MELPITPLEQLSPILWTGTQAYKMLCRVESLCYCHVNSRARSGHRRSYVTSPASYKNVVVVYLTTLSVAEITQRWWQHVKWMMNSKGSGRGLIPGTISAFAWRKWGKPRKPSVRIAGLRAEIWIRTSRIRSRSDNNSNTTFGIFYTKTNILFSPKCSLLFRGKLGKQTHLIYSLEV
jgi:hypothetical protein